MSRRALIILLAGFPLAAPALGQAVYRMDPPASGEEYRHAQRRYPHFRSETSRARRRHETSRRTENNGNDQSPRQEADREAIEIQIGRLQNENAALKRELAARITEDRRAELERQLGRLQDENAALKQENVSLKKDLAAAASSAPGKMELPANAGQPDKVKADLDRRFGFVEKAWRRLIDVVGNLKRG